jgi:hypothetical protein
MIAGFDDSVGRRRFLLNLAWMVSGGAAAVHGARAGQRGASPPEDAPNTHNMLAVGRETVFLSHLPMFDAANEDRTDFTSPHRFQVVLEATFANGNRNVTPLYTADRAAHPATRIYTVGPAQDSFVLSHLFTPADKPRVNAFGGATVFRGHLEHGGVGIPGLQDTQVKITRVVHAHKFDPKAKKPDQLEYIVFGKGTELFLAHTIAGPPDCDHVLSARMTGQTYTDTELRQDIRVVFAARKNVASERVRAGQRLDGALRIGGATTAPVRVQVQADVEFYFEEGELLVPATFNPTPEERKAT